jgi:hypothetical protein
MDENVKKFKDALDVLAVATLYSEIKNSMDFDRHDLMKATEIFNCIAGGMAAREMIKKNVSIETGGKMAEMFAKDVIALLEKWCNFHPHDYIKNELRNDPYVIARGKNNNNNNRIEKWINQNI